jgi:tetratricopeptide (TPR) repeat protein
MRHWFTRFRFVIALLGPVAFFPIFLANAQTEQQNMALDALFAELRTAPDSRTAQAITIEIWNLWTHPDDPELAARMAEILQRLGMADYPGAVALLDRLVVDHPDYAEGWNQRATAHFLMRNFDQSLADIEKTLQAEPRHFGALAGRALIYLELDQRDLALEAITQALAIHPFLSERGLFPELNAIQI